MPTAPPISFAGSELDETRHVCAFFAGEAEEYRVLLPFIKDGFERGDKAVHFVSPDDSQNHLERLAAAGIQTAGALQSGQFELRTTTEGLRDGRFDPDRMLGVFEELAIANARSTFGPGRIVCRMDWAAEQGPYADDFIEFEARVNDVWSGHHDTVICTYHLAKFGGPTVINVLRTHPLVIIGGVLQRNPFFIPPREFLRQIREQRAAQRNARPRSTGAA
jgi:hypothetical protein